MTPTTRLNIRWFHGAALVLYAAVAVILLYHGEPLTKKLEGQGGDPIDLTWFLDWWPFAIAHHLNPLHTALVWQPTGISLAWISSVPLLSLLGLPLTLLSGPVLAYNSLSLSGPVLAAWMAYWLCLKITHDPPAALIGGFLFGFSSYEMQQELGTLNLSFIVLVPALLLIVVTRLESRLSRPATVALASLTLIAQFLISVEIFATIFVFGGLAWIVAMIYMPERRGVLRRLFVDGLTAGPIVILALSPFLGSMLANAHATRLPEFWPYYFVTDLLDIVIPGKMNLWGGLASPDIFTHVENDDQERGGYLGLPLLLIIVLFARRQGALPAGRFLIITFMLAVVFSFGPRLWIAGHYSAIVLPWMIFVKLPLLSSALPARFIMYAALASSIIAALWLADPATPGRRGRFALGILACVTLLPFPHPWMNIPHSRFFQPGRVQAELGPHPRIMIFPFAINGPSSLWQDESRFSFSQTGGYLGFPPAAMQIYPAAMKLFGGDLDDLNLTEFVKFVTVTETEFIVAGPGTSPALLAKLQPLKWPSRSVDDVIIYTVPGAGGRPFHE